MNPLGDNGVMLSGTGQESILFIIVFIKKKRETEVSLLNYLSYVGF
jgi:hypothetical protein